MRTVRTIMATLLAFAWVMLTSHCRLEAASGFEFLRCAPASPATTASAPAHDGTHAQDEDCANECADEGCCPLETGSVQAKRLQELQPTPVSHDFSPSFLPALLESLTLTLRASDHDAPRQTAPPDPLPPSPWQFAQRTALPPRAPSPAHAS